MAWQANGRYRPNDVTTWKSELCMPRHANLAKSSVDKKITEKVQSKLWCVLGSMGISMGGVVLLHTEVVYRVLYSLVSSNVGSFYGPMRRTTRLQKRSTMDSLEPHNLISDAEQGFKQGFDQTPNPRRYLMTAHCLPRLEFGFGGSKQAMTL